MKLKENLRYLRKKSGLTQMELAKKMHLKQYNISDYEIGRIEPNIDKLIRFADIFNVSLDFLVGRKTTGLVDPVLPGEEDTSAPEHNGEDTEDAPRALDPFIIDIQNQIRGLSDEEKAKVVETIAFFVKNFTTPKE